MSKKYQIFVSSTFTDLKDERDLVIKAILELGHIPVGMEMFSAADEEQWAVIQRNIEQTDYYVVIAAHRYGSTTATGVSYTEKEYDYAVSQGIPVLGFVIDSTASWPGNLTDTEPSAVSAIALFKDKIKKKHISFWKNKEDLYGKCSIALSKTFTATPREGWIRASQATDVRTAAELARLSAENSELRQLADKARSATKSEVEDESNRVVSILERNKRTISLWRADGQDWEVGPTVTLLQIFDALAPELLIHKSKLDMAPYIAALLGNLPRPEQRNEWPIPSNQLASYLADLATLGLVGASDRRISPADTNEYWTLTAKGKELMSRIRRRALENAADDGAP